VSPSLIGAPLGFRRVHFTSVVFSVWTCTQLGLRPAPCRYDPLSYPLLLPAGQGLGWHPHIPLNRPCTNCGAQHSRRTCPTAVRHSGRPAPTPTQPQITIRQFYRCNLFSRDDISAYPRPTYCRRGTAGFVCGQSAPAARGSTAPSNAAPLSLRNVVTCSILLGCLLYLQLICDCWARAQDNDIQYHRDHQAELRADLYDDVAQAFASTHADPARPTAVDANRWSQRGRNVIIPSSFVGGYR